MLDLKLLSRAPEEVKAGMAAKGFDPQIVEAILPLANKARKLQTEAETVRSERRRLSELGPHAAERGRKLKDHLDDLTSRLRTVEGELEALLLQVPNLPSQEAPRGQDETANVVVKKVGEPPVMSEAMDHLQLAEIHDLIDLPRAAKISGSRFSFLKNEAVHLELALIHLAFDRAEKAGYRPMITPELVNEKTIMGTGYLPHGAEEVYKTDDDFYLIGTSEQPLVAYHGDEVLLESQLPLRYVGFSSCFRREAGSYGRDTRGVMRTHQFDKVELVSFVKPEDSPAELDRILQIEEEIVQTLGLPYRVVEICTGDLGVQAARKYDIEIWMPGQGKYRETHSCSNTTDFQARRLNIRYKTQEGKNELVHTLNGTAVAIGRVLIAILENGQQSDRTIKIPRPLVPFCGFHRIGRG